MNILFICNQNQNRSITAEEIFKKMYQTKSAGLYNQSPVSGQQLNWADIIIVMEEHQRSELAKRFPLQYMKKRILSLEIPDIYKRNDPVLIRKLQDKIQECQELF